ncbi:MAG: ComEC family competence protein, partial [Pseudomonadota bacterium]
FTLGGAWLCLWRTRWRLWGVAAMAAGLAAMAFDRPPDLLVEGRGKSFAVRLADGSLLVQKGGRILKETWDRRAGPLADERWPRKSRSSDGRLACDPLGCVWRADGRVAALVLDDDGIAPACDSAAEIVLSAVPIREACRGAKVVVDRFDLWRRGAHALWVEDGGKVRIETVAAWQGDRPWSYRPVRRKKKVAEEADEPPKDEEGDED